LSAPVIAFFNNKGGVGKTSLVFHLSWMYADLGLEVIAMDLDPQANLTAAFLDEERLEELWPEGPHPLTISGAVRPLVTGEGDISEPVLEPIREVPDPFPQVSSFSTETLHLIVGDLGLSAFEDELAESWSKCLSGSPRAFRVVSAFHRLARRAADRREADVVLMDLGPNLGAINRAALIAADYVVFPLSADLFSLQGLRNLGPTLRTWRTDWRKRLEQNAEPGLPLSAGDMQPVGYVVLQHSVRLDRPVKTYDRWIARIPQVYRDAILGERGEVAVEVEDDPHCLLLLKHYRSLMPLAQEARKPMFHLKPADGAIGAHVEAVRGVRQDFERLARVIARRVGLGGVPGEAVAGSGV
jgi:chromosome partitioning protein